MSATVLKVLIVILFIAVVVSLSSALLFLFKDTATDRKRTAYALGVRITLASMLLGLVFYGVYSGELTLTAPWHGR